MIYRMLVEEIRWEAVFPGDEWLILMIGADFLHFTSKLVRI